MQFENTEMSKEDKKMLLMVLLTYLSRITLEYQNSEDEEFTTFCNTFMQIYKDNKDKILEIFCDIRNEVISKFAMQTLKNLLQEF